MTKAAPTLALLLGAHLNLTALVPAAAGQGPPPWWVGGGLFWPFFADTARSLPAGGLRDALTPLLGIVAATCLLMAAAALLGWLVPGSWFTPARRRRRRRLHRPADRLALRLDRPAARARRRSPLAGVRAAHLRRQPRDARDAVGEHAVSAEVLAVGRGRVAVAAVAAAAAAHLLDMRRYGRIRQEAPWCLRPTGTSTTPKAGLDLPCW